MKQAKVLSHKSLSRKEIKRFRVLHITSNLGTGGLERVITLLCTKTDSSLFEPAVCCLHFKGPFAETLERLGIPIYLIKQTRRTDYLAFLKIKKIIHGFKPDIIHTHNTNSSFDGVIAAVMTGTPIRIHTDHARQFPDKKRYMVAEWMLSHFVDKIVAVSSETRDNLIKFEHIAPKRISVINNGVEEGVHLHTKVLQEKRVELGLCDFEYLIGFAGRLEPEKGAKYLVYAAPSVLKKYPFTCFVFAGQGSQLDFLKKESKRLKIDHAIRFIGNRDDIPVFLRLLDVYVLPSEREGLPMSLLEAMAARCAIVASHVGGIPTAINHRTNGLLCSPKSPQEIALAICELLANHPLRISMGESAIKTFSELYTAESMTRSYENLYLEYLKKKDVFA